MKKFTKICLIIVGVFAFLGLGMLGGAMALGATSLDVKSEMSSSRVWNRISSELHEEWFDFWDDHSDFDFTDEDYADYEELQGDGEYHTYDFSEIEELKIDVERCAVYLETSSDADCHVAVDKNGGIQDVEVKQSGKELAVKCDSKERPEAEIYIYLPEIQMDKVNIDIGGGYLSIEDLETEKLEVSAGSGVVEVYGNVLAEKSAWEVGVGTMEICMAGREEDYDYEISCGIGTVNMPLDSYSGLGTAKKIKNENAEYEMGIECGVGTIDFSFEE